MKTKKQLTKRILSLVLTLVMVLGMIPLSAFAASGYSYIDADGSEKNVASATEITSSATTWNSGWYYVGANVTISSRITVSGDVKLILGAGYTLTAGEGIWVSGGNTLTVYSQQTVGSLVATGLDWNAAIGGNGKAGTSGANVDTSVGTIIINGGNVTATGGKSGAGIGSGWGGVGGSVTVNGGNVTATGGDSGAGIGSSQKATNNISITITGGNVNATGGMGAASIGAGYAAEDNNAAIIHISGGNITAGRNWAAASIGNGVGVDSATKVSITGGVIDAELIGNYSGGWTAEIAEISGTTFLKDPSAYIINGQYVEKDTDGKYHVHWGGAYISGISQVNSITVMINGNVYAISNDEYRIIDGTLHLFVPQGDMFVTVNNTDYYGIYSGNSSELQRYYKVTNLSTMPTAINANTAYELATTVTPENALNQTFSYEVTDAGTTGAFLNGNILTAPYGGELKLKTTAKDSYKTYSKTFTIKVTQTSVTGISGDNVIPTTADSVSITLPTAVLPTNASHKTIEWSVIEGPAVISNGILKFISSGECVVRATVKNGIAYGEDYTKDYKIKITAPSAIDVSQGDIVFSKQDENTMKVTYGNGQQMTFPANQTTAVTGSTNRYHIIIQSGSVNLILQDCNISVTDSAAMSIQSGASAELTLVGTNKLEGIGGIHVPSGASLSIDGTGTLTAISVTRYEAGIGGGNKESGGAITITDGTVTATGGQYGAGIGGGLEGSGGTITINGGTVTATGEYGAGIGGGYEGSSGGTITINGGTVIATGNVYGAGIGGGRNGSGGTITINGGIVTTTGVKYGAGIGGGGGSAGNGGAITINGGTVKATSGEDGAGIGGGDNGSGDTITINGGTITATSDESGAGIGGGDKGSGGTITINGGTVTATGGEYGAGIGGGNDGNGGNVVVTGGNVKAVPGIRKSEAIGKGDGGSNSGTLKDTTGNDLILNTIMLNDATADTAVTATKGITYGLNDVKTLDTDRLYFYLPVDTAATAITAGGVEYICNRNNVYYTNHGNDGYNNITKNTHDVICSECETVFSADVLHTYDENKKCVCGYINHTHEWSYSVDGTKISASCSNSDGGCSDTDGGSVTLKVTDAYFTGSAIDATVTGSFTNGATYKVTYNGSETVPSSIGTHTAKLTVYENGIEKASVTTPYEITYLPVPENPYSISGHGYYDETNNTYWFKNGATVTVKAPSEYKISTMQGGIYGSSVSFSEGDDMVIYLKEDTGAMTDAINVEGVRFDGNAPTGKITVTERNFWQSLLNKITFGLFFKGDAVATVSARDVESGWESIQYYLANKDLIDNENFDNVAAISALEDAIGDNWKTYNNEIALNKNAKNVIYVKITDNVGNVAYINSEGIVLYSDAKAVTESVSTTYKVGEDTDVTVELNGNTVESVANGTTVLTEGTDYTVSNDGTITLKADYLDTLSAATYTFTVSYNPLGETYVEVEGNVEPATTAFTLSVAPASIENADVTVNGTFTYDGAEKTPDPVVKLNGVILTKDTDYTVSYADNVNAGDATITVSGMGNYSGTASGRFEIERANLTDVSVQQNGKLTYDGGKALTPTVSINAVAVNDQPITFTYSTAEDGTYGSMPNFTEAGTYTVYFKASAPNHNEATGYFTVTVDKAIVEVPTLASKVYNGSPQYADISSTDFYDVKENNHGTKVGEYSVVLKLIDSTNYKWATTEKESISLTFEITKATNEWKTEPTISGWTYGETANVPTYEAKLGPVKVVYSGKANDGTDYNSEIAPIKAGNYTATFTVEETEDYSGLSEQVKFTIAKKAVTVTANDASKTYGDNDPTLTYTHTDLVGSDALDITVARASGENANTYTITASQVEGANPNYEITFENGTFTIRKATLIVTVEDKTATYGDAVPNYTVKYDGFKNGDDKDDLGGTLAFDCGYAQFDDKGEYTVKASGYTSGNYTINYVDGKLNVGAKPITVTIQNVTSIYGETLAELKATDNGIVNDDTNVYSLATVATNTSDVGKYEITGTALDSNYDITFVNGEYEITKREIAITVEAKNTIVNTELPTYTYKVEGLVGEDKLVTEPTLVSDADITVISEYDITANGADAGDNYSIKYVPAKLTVLTDDAVDVAAGYTEKLKDYDPATVTSEDKAELDEILDEINTILDDENITDNGKKALEEVKEQVEDLIKEITDAAEAADTENTKKVEDVTAENVTPGDKTDLEKAKADLEKTLVDNAGNYTEDEKKAIEEEIKRIEDALEVIGNVEAVEALIDKLPDTIKKDDEAAIKVVDDAYNALSAYEKSIVDKDVKKALDDAKAALAELKKPADSDSPATGDNSDLWLWFAFLFVSGTGIFGITLYDRKRKVASKR